MPANVEPQARQRERPTAYRLRSGRRRQLRYPFGRCGPQPQRWVFEVDLQGLGSFFGREPAEEAEFNYLRLPRVFGSETGHWVEHIANPGKHRETGQAPL